MYLKPQAYSYIEKKVFLNDLEKYSKASNFENFILEVKLPAEAPSSRHSLLVWLDGSFGKEILDMF